MAAALQLGGDPTDVALASALELAFRVQLGDYGKAGRTEDLDMWLFTAAYYAMEKAPAAFPALRLARALLLAAAAKSPVERDADALREAAIAVDEATERLGTSQ